MALIETNYIRPQEVYDRNTGESKVRYRSYDGNDRFIPVMEGENGVPKTLVEVTHAELKAMRDGGKLTPGSLYRLTDYNCTTTQENTQSAGHQFDIVLLALSENKLAEEGWAMMHDNIYDVTFADGVTLKCYWYQEPQQVEDKESNLVACDTMLGSRAFATNIDLEGEAELNVNTTNKTAVCAFNSSILYSPTSEVSYNYFQNSNLSAWKVWYCLDNDKSRFAWADDSVDEGEPASITYRTNKDFTYTRNSSIDKVEDGVQYYGWGKNVFTKTLDIVVGETQCWNAIGTLLSRISAYTPAHEGTGLPNGRGVIYRLIDEWNIDYPCDFKNMQMLIPMDGKDNIDMENPVRYKYCYAFTDNTSGEPEDLSIKGHAFNIKVKANLVVEDSTIYISPRTLFYKKREELIFHFSDITVGIANNAIFINHGRAINILDGSNNIILITCVNISIGNNSYNVMLNAVSDSTFGSNCKNIQLANVGGLNYGNNGVELATKS